MTAAGPGARTHALTDFSQAGHQDPEGYQVGRLHLVPLPAEERQPWGRLTRRPRLLGGLFGCSRPRQGQPEQRQCGAQHPAACLAALPAPHGRRPRVAAAAAYRPPPRHRHVGPAPPNPGSDTPKPGPDSETLPRASVSADACPSALNQSRLWKFPSAALPQVLQPIPSSALPQTLPKPPPTRIQSCERPQPSRGTSAFHQPVATVATASRWSDRGLPGGGVQAGGARPRHRECCQQPAAGPRYRGRGLRRCRVQTGGAPFGSPPRPELRTRTGPVLESREGQLSPSSPEIPRPRLDPAHSRLNRRLFLFIYQTEGQPASLSLKLQ